jgi:hypothetical protein
MMELMQKYIKEDGAVGIDNLDRWRTCPAAIEFLCALTSASSFEELKEVCFPCFFPQGGFQTVLIISSNDC